VYCTLIVTDVCTPPSVPAGPALGETLADAPLSGLRQVRGRGDQHVAQLGCPDLDGTPARGLAVLPRASSAEVTGYSLDMRVS
jgi:hypothetical protein